MQFSFSHHRLKINILWLPEQAHRFTGYLISDPGVSTSKYNRSLYRTMFQCVTVKAPRRIIDVGVSLSHESPAPPVHEDSPAPGALVVGQQHQVKSHDERRGARILNSVFSCPGSDPAVQAGHDPDRETLHSAAGGGGRREDVVGPTDWSASEGTGKKYF